MANCSKCGKKLRSDNTKGICGASVACSKRAKNGAAEAPAEMKPPPPARRPKKVAGVSWLERFRQLHAALGLDADEALDEHCREWVESVTSRALGQSTAKPVRLHARPAERPQLDTATAEG
jgi:hypothetical protein